MYVSSVDVIRGCFTEEATNRGARATFQGKKRCAGLPKSDIKATHQFRMHAMGGTERRRAMADWGSMLGDLDAVDAELGSSQDHVDFPPFAVPGKLENGGQFRLETHDAFQLDGARVGRGVRELANGGMFRRLLRGEP